MTSRVAVVVHLEEQVAAVALVDPSVVTGRLEEYDFFSVVAVVHSVVAEMTGHLLEVVVVGRSPMTYRVALVPVVVPPVRALEAASVLLLLALLRPRMMRKFLTLKKRSCDSLTQVSALVPAQHLALHEMPSLPSVV